MEDIETEELPPVMILRDLKDLEGSSSDDDGKAWKLEEDINFDEMEELLSKFLADERISDAIRSGESLKGMSERVRQELGTSMGAALGAYVERADEFATLHQEILGCDTILKRMEDMLTVFQDNLKEISADIRSLQEESSSMNIRLKNRKDVESRLSSFLDDLCLTPELVSTLLNATEIDGDFLENLVILHRKIKTVNKVIKYHTKSATLDSSAKSDSIPRAIRDAAPMLLKLRNKCCATIRATLLSDKGFHYLLKPQSNVSVYQQSVLLRLRPAYQFLLHHAKDVATEVRSYYVAAMADRFYNVFKVYTADVAKVYAPSHDKNDLVGVPEGTPPASASSGGGWGSWLGLGGGGGPSSPAASASATSTRNPTVRFGLGSRKALLDDLGAPAILVHAGPSEKVTYSLPEVYRSLQFMFADSVSAEVQFCRDFFSLDLFDAVFARTVALLHSQLKSWLAPSFDTPGLVMMLHITYRFKVMMHKARDIRIDALQACYGASLDAIRERLCALLALHVRSLDPLLHSAAASSSPSPKAAVLPLSPHYTALHFAELAAAYRFLSVGMHEPAVEDQFSALAHAVAEAVKTLSGRAGAHELAHTVFYLNSVGAVVAALNAVRPLSAASDSADAPSAPSASRAPQEQSLFAQLQDVLAQKLVSLCLRGRFASLVGFVARARDASAAKIAAVEASDLVAQFADSWKQALHDLRSDVAALSPPLARLVLKDVYAQVTVLHDSLEDYVRAAQPSLLQSLVPKTTLSYEISKIIREFS